MRGTASDNGKVVRVTVNGKDARSLREDFAEWEIVLDAADAAALTAQSTDAAGNVEKTPHVLTR